MSVDTLEARMLTGMGTWRSGPDAMAITDSMRRWSDASTIPELFDMLPGTYQYETGEEGKPLGLVYLGANGVSEGVTVDGVPLGSPLFGTVIYGLFPLESVDGMELLSGPDALLAGSRWNIVTRQFASARPRTGVRFVQEPFESILSDAYFSQNIARSTNLLFGFQRRTSDGRFRNARLDSWHVRGRLRYNVSPRLNVMGNWSYEKTSNGLNGGVDRLVSPTLFDDVSAVVVEPDAYDLLTATDLSLHVLADVLGDSLSYTRLFVHERQEEREFYRVTASLYEPSARQYAVVTRRDFRVDQSLAVPFALVRGMAKLEKLVTKESEVLRPVSRTTSGIGFSVEGTLAPWVVPSFGIRVDRTPEGSRSSVAGKVELNPLPDLRISGVMEQHTNGPEFQQLAWSDSQMVFQSTPRTTTDELKLLGIRWNATQSTSVGVEGFERHQTGRLFFFPDTTASGIPIYSARTEDINWTGVSVSGRLGFGPVSVGGWITFSRPEGSDSLAALLPKAWARWDLTWKDRYFEDALGVRVSLRGTFYDRHDGITIEPRTFVQVVQSEHRVGRLTRLDASIILDIGDTFVTIAWENLINTQYFKIPTYPMSDRRFMLGVRWEFND